MADCKTFLTLLPFRGSSKVAQCAYVGSIIGSVLVQAALLKVIPDLLYTKYNSLDDSFNSLITDICVEYIKKSVYIAEGVVAFHSLCPQGLGCIVGTLCSHYISFMDYLESPYCILMHTFTSFYTLISYIHIWVAYIF